MNSSNAFYKPLGMWLGFLGGSNGKESAYNAGDTGSILGWEYPLEEGMTTHSSILAQRIPWTEESGKLQSMGSRRAGHDWTTNTFTCTGTCSLIYVFSKLMANFRNTVSWQDTKVYLRHILYVLVRLYLRIICIRITRICWILG